MSTFTIKVTAQDGSNQYVEELELDIDQIRKTPNPRQALTSHFMAMTRKVIAEVDPSINV